MTGSGVSGVSGTAVAATAAGAVLVYSGIKGIGVSASLRSVISGKPPPVSQTTPITQVSAAAPAATGGGLIIPGTPGAPGGGSAAQNQAIARLLAAPYGWSAGAQWAALVSLWESESGWSNTIWNTSASCGNGAYAYGIPQACGHGVNKQTANGSWGPYPAGSSANPPEYGGSSSAAAQISWGLAYIKANYGSPLNVPHGGY